MNAAKMAQAFIALGSNLHDPRAQVLRGFDALDGLPDSKLVARSRLYRSAPWGVVDQPAFVNAAAGIETGLSPRELLDALLAIERDAGRERGGARWGPRILDLDLLLYDALILREDGLTLPHPQLHERAFVLLPLADIAPDFVVPGHGCMSRLLERMDTASCEILR